MLRFLSNLGPKNQGFRCLAVEKRQVLLIAIEGDVPGHEVLKNLGHYYEENPVTASYSTISDTRRYSGYFRDQDLVDHIGRLFRLVAQHRLIAQHRQKHFVISVERRVTRNLADIYRRIANLPNARHAIDPAMAWAELFDGEPLPSFARRFFR